MKKLSLFLIMLIAFGVTQSFGQITGSAHDFTDGDAWNTNTSNKMCGVCHTPHNANTAVSDAPLWNHDLSAVATYTVYGGSATLDATVGQPSSISKLCLACHDGTVALDNGPGANATMIGAVGTGTGDLGSDLSGDHPISFTYDAALSGTDGGLFDPTTTASSLGANIDDDMLFGAGNNQLECSSCHDVHNQNNHANLLLLDNTNSELCLTCHNK